MRVPSLMVIGLAILFVAPAVAQTSGNSSAPVFGMNQAQVNLGLYSITFNNDATLDRASLEAYRAFREEAWERLTQEADVRHDLATQHPPAKG